MNHLDISHCFSLNVEFYYRHQTITISATTRERTDAELLVMATKIGHYFSCP